MRTIVLDYYAALRAAYRQNRAHAIRNGAAAPLPALDEFDDFDDGINGPFSYSKLPETSQFTLQYSLKD